MRRSSDVRYLNSGTSIPVLGFGTYSYENDKHTTQLAIETALKGYGNVVAEKKPATAFPGSIETRTLKINGMGYRHFDTAKIYGSEPAVGCALGEAIMEGKVEREELFVTSKLWCSDHNDPVSALKQTLRNLEMEYVDMYLVHWPVKFKSWATYPIPNKEDFEPLDLERTWAGMEKCLEMGLSKSIGVSNFSTTKIHQLLEYGSVPPAINQVEMHPMWRQTKLRDFCAEKGVHVSAYSPLGGPGNFWGSSAVVNHPVIQSIALKHGATPAQVALKWGLSKESSVIVKSFNRERMKENMGALNIRLDNRDFADIEKMEEWKILRGDFLVNGTTSPYRTIQDLWDGEI